MLYKWLFLPPFACTKYVGISEITASHTFPGQPCLIYERSILIYFINNVETTHSHPLVMSMSTKASLEKENWNSVTQSLENKKLQIPPPVSLSSPLFSPLPLPLLSSFFPSSLLILVILLLLFQSQSLYLGKNLGELFNL